MLSLSISIVALSISLVTAWLTLFQRGRLKMTQPTQIYFGPDGGRDPNDRDGMSKVYFRSLIYSTGKRGIMIESLHVRLTRSETVQNFNIWVYGDALLTRGSGLFVGQEGVGTNHHFFTPEDNRRYEFRSGSYRFQIFATVVGKKSAIKLWDRELEVGPTEADELTKGRFGLYFDWGPDSKKYLPHIDRSDARGQSSNQRTKIAKFVVQSEDNRVSDK